MSTEVGPLLNSQGLSVFTSGQKRGVTDKIKRELRRRSAVEPVIGHLKSDHRMYRNHLKGGTDDAMDDLLAATAAVTEPVAEVRAP